MTSTPAPEGRSADVVPIMMWTAGPDMLRRFSSQGWLMFTGRTLLDESGNGWLEGVHAEDLARVEAAFQAAFAHQSAYTIEYRRRHADGGFRWLLEHVVPRFGPVGELLGLMGTSIDMTAYKLEVEAIKYQALHDPLTGLSNRTLFFDRLDHAVLTSSRHHVPFSVLYLDLCAFKTINDTLGLAVGELVLKEAARRIRKVVRLSDTVARFGRDDFAVILPAADALVASLIASRITGAFQIPMASGTDIILVDICVGVVGYPEHGPDAVSLVRQAEEAIHAAKQERANPCVYCPHHQHTPPPAATEAK